jgi:hypothetical protein
MHKEDIMRIDLSIIIAAALAGQKAYVECTWIRVHARFTCTSIAYARRADSFYDAGIDKKTMSVCYRVDYKLSHEPDCMSDWATTRSELLMSRRYTSCEHLRVI